MRLPTRLGSPTRFIPLNWWTGSYLLLVGIGVCCCVEGACEEVDRRWDVELVCKEEQEVLLTLSLLLEWSILGLGGRYFLDLVPGSDF